MSETLGNRIWGIRRLVCVPFDATYLNTLTYRAWCTGTVSSRERSCQGLQLATKVCTSRRARKGVTSVGRCKSQRNMEDLGRGLRNLRFRCSFFLLVRHSQCVVLDATEWRPRCQMSITYSAGLGNLPKIENWQIEGRRWSRNTDGYNETTKTQNLLFKRVASGQLHDQRLISKRAITVSGKFVVVGGFFTVLSWILIDSRY